MSRSIHEEARRVLYRHGHFRFDAFSAGSRPLDEVIECISVFSGLQSITLRLDVNVAISLGHSKEKFFRSATMLTNYLARLVFHGPPRRCVVDIEVGEYIAFVFGESHITKEFIHALGSLTGFKTVEVKVGVSKMEERRWLLAYCAALDERLEMTLGKGEPWHLSERGVFILSYHPR